MRYVHFFQHVNASCSGQNEYRPNGTERNTHLGNVSMYDAPSESSTCTICLRGDKNMPCKVSDIGIDVCICFCTRLDIVDV